MFSYFPENMKRTSTISHLQTTNPSACTTVHSTFPLTANRFSPLLEVWVPPHLIYSRILFLQLFCVLGITYCSLSQLSFLQLRNMILVLEESGKEGREGKGEEKGEGRGGKIPKETNLPSSYPTFSLFFYSAKLFEVGIDKRVSSL